MLMKMDTSWLLFAIAAVTMLAYLLSLGLDAVLRDDGYGPFGNALIISGAFFGTIYLANRQGYRFSSLMDAAASGLGGAFVALFVLIIVRAILRRMA